MLLEGERRDVLRLVVLRRLEMRVLHHLLRMRGRRGGERKTSSRVRNFMFSPLVELDSPAIPEHAGQPGADNRKQRQH